MKAWYGEKLRKYFSEHNPLKLIDLWSNVFSSATVDSNILVIQNHGNDRKTHAMILRDHSNDLSLKMKNATITDFSNSWSWFIGSNNENDLKSKIESGWKALKDLGYKINYGIKTGLNEAFIIDSNMREKIIAEDPKSIELIKPLLRWRDIRKYRNEYSDLYIIGTFPVLNINIESYQGIKKYLLWFWKERLEQSGKKYPDAGFNARKLTWNEWFETQDQISYYAEFENEKIIYPVMSTEGSFYYDTHWFYCNDKWFIITGSHLKYLIAILNSKITHYYLCQICSPLGNEAIEYRKIYIETFPVPEITSDNNFIVLELESLVDKILKIREKDINTDITDIELLINSLVYQLYKLSPEEITIIEGGK